MYSDIDYMLLGYIIEQITGQRLDEYVENNIYRPMGLTHTLFNPLQKGFKKEQFAATERNGNSRDHMIDFPGVRNYTVQGEVHDEKAFYSLGGVAGHTGWVGIDSCIDLKHDMAIILLTNKVHAPCLAGQPNKFTTDNFETGKYGSIISMVYEALLEK